MSDEKYSPERRGDVAALSIDELEAGLHIPTGSDAGRNSLWEEKVGAFRQTVLFAIRETSDALLSPTIPLRWHVELENQLGELLQHLDLANRYIATQLPPRHALRH